MRVSSPEQFSNIASRYDTVRGAKTTSGATAGSGHKTGTTAATSAGAASFATQVTAAQSPASAFSASPAATQTALPAAASQAATPLVRVTETGGPVQVSETSTANTGSTSQATGSTSTDQRFSVDELVQALNFLRQYASYMNSVAASSSAGMNQPTQASEIAQATTPAASTANAATQMYSQVSAY